MIDRRHRNDPDAYLVFADMEEDNGFPNYAALMRQYGEVLRAVLAAVRTSEERHFAGHRPANCFMITPDGWRIWTKCCNARIDLVVGRPDGKPGGRYYLYRDVKQDWTSYVCRKVRSLWGDKRR